MVTQPGTARQLYDRRDIKGTPGGRPLSSARWRATRCSAARADPHVELRSCDRGRDGTAHVQQRFRGWALTADGACFPPPPDFLWRASSPAASAGRLWRPGGIHSRRASRSRAIVARARTRPELFLRSSRSCRERCLRPRHPVTRSSRNVGPHRRAARRSVAGACAWSGRS